jgi:transposase
MESSPDRLTSESRFFLEPTSAAQRQYEALRAYFVEGLSSADVSRRFGYTPGSFRVLCHHFRRSKPDFFRELKHGPHSQPKKDALRELILGMRKQNLSIYDIESALRTQQTPLSTTAIWEILHEEGFARLPRRQDEQRPATLHPTAAAIADCREFSLAPRRFTTQVGGLFLFLPLLVDCDLPGLVRQTGYESAQSRQLFRHFLNTPAEVEITDKFIEVTLPKRAHNPLSLAAGFGQGSTPIPWWDGRRLVLKFR